MAEPVGYWRYMAKKIRSHRCCGDSVSRASLIILLGLERRTYNMPIASVTASVQ